MNNGLTVQQSCSTSWLTGGHYILCTVLLSPPTSGVWGLPHQPQLYTCLVVMAAIPQPVQIFSGCKGACVLLPSQAAVVFLLVVQYTVACMLAAACLFAARHTFCMLYSMLRILCTVPDPPHITHLQLLQALSVNELSGTCFCDPDTPNPFNMTPPANFSLCSLLPM